MLFVFSSAAHWLRCARFYETFVESIRSIGGEFHRRLKGYFFVGFVLLVGFLFVVVFCFCWFVLLAGWLVGWLVGRLVGWLVGFFVVLRLANSSGDSS